MKFARYALLFLMLMEGEATWLMDTESDSYAKGTQKLWKVTDLGDSAAEVVQASAPTKAWSPSEEYPVYPNTKDIVVGKDKHYSPSKGEIFLRDGVEFGNVDVDNKFKHDYEVSMTDEISSTKASSVTKLRVCDQIRTRFEELSETINDLLGDKVDIELDIRELITRSMVIADMFNPLQWKKKLRDTFFKFIDLKEPNLYSLQGLETLCDDLLSIDYAPLAECAAGVFNGTITMAFEVSFTFLGGTGSLGIDVSWGESGEKSCALLKGGGFLDHSKGLSTGVLGLDISASVDFMPGFWGGFKNVGSNHRDGGKVVTTSISMGVGGDVGIVLVSDLAKIEEEELRKQINEGIQKFIDDQGVVKSLVNASGIGNLGVLTYFCDLLNNAVSGLVGFGITISMGGDFLDIITSIIGDPDYSYVFGSELVIKCEANSEICAGKASVQDVALERGAACQMPTQCFLCRETATPWYGNEDSLNPTQLRCGKQSCWPDKTPCNQHPWNTCDPSKSTNLDRIYYSAGQTCCNKASFWYGHEYLPITAPSNNGNRCGSQPKWPDGTSCDQLPTNKCKACTNTATKWYGDQWLPTGKRCGTQPGWPDGTPCGQLINNSCKACKNKAYAWYGDQYLPTGKRCGTQPGWPDGTPCDQLINNSCKACKNEAYAWYGDQYLPTGKRCGTQPGWPRGTPCGQLINNSCKACKDEAYAWYGSEYLPTGKRCGKQTCWGKDTGCGTPNSPCDKACCKYKNDWWNWNCD